jgi:hypothetical protein
MDATLIGLPQPGLRRVLRATDYFTLAFGSIVGVGWMVVIEEWLTAGGPAGAMLAFLLGGLALIPVALAYGRLAARMPEAASEVAYTAAVFPRPVSFLTGWAMTFAYLVVCPYEAVAIGRLAAYLFPAMNSLPLYGVGGHAVYLPHLVLGISVTLVIAVLNYRGIRFSALFQNWTTSRAAGLGLSPSGSRRWPAESGCSTSLTLTLPRATRTPVPALLARTAKVVPSADTSRLSVATTKFSWPGFASTRISPLDSLMCRDAAIFSLVCWLTKRMEPSGSTIRRRSLVPVRISTPTLTVLASGAVGRGLLVKRSGVAANAAVVSRATQKRKRMGCTTESSFVQVECKRRGCELSGAKMGRDPSQAPADEEDYMPR